MKKFVLVVDDSPTVRAAAKFVLGEAGFDVETAENGIDGIHKLKTIDKDGDATAMIISDVNMPKMDGITFIRIVKNTPFKEIPILVMTTESTESIKDEGRKAGAIGWLVKPFNPAQLVSVVKKFVNNH